MAWLSLGEFLKAAQDAGEVVRVPAAVETGLEIAAITQQITRSAADGGPVLIFESVRHSTLPVVTNVLGSRQRVARAVGVTRLEELSQRLTESAVGNGFWETLKRLPHSSHGGMSPKVVKQALCQQVVKLGRDINLWELPVLRNGAREEHPCLTAGLVIAFDPTTGTRTVDRVPVQITDRQQVQIHWTPQHAAYRWAQAVGPQLQVAIALGGDPALLIAEAAQVGHAGDPWTWAGVVRGAPLEVTAGRTVEVEVPAEAECVLEGRLERPVSPSASPPLLAAAGHYRIQPLAFSMTVSALTHRANPLFPAIVPGGWASEDRWIERAAERLLIPGIQQVLPAVIDVHAPSCGAGGRIVFVRVRKEYPGHARQVLQVLLGLPATHHAKLLVAVDEDVDLSKPDAVWWSVSAFADLSRDAITVMGPADPTDVALSQTGSGGKLAIDATRKWPGETAQNEPHQALELAAEIRARLQQRWAEYGLPARWGESL